MEADDDLLQESLSANVCAARVRTAMEGYPISSMRDYVLLPLRRCVETRDLRNECKLYGSTVGTVGA